MGKTSGQSALISFSYLLVGSLSLFIAFPLFILAHKQLPDYGWPYHADRVLMFVFFILFALLLLRLFRPALNIIFAVTLLYLAYGSFAGSYGFRNLVTDYKAMFYTLKYEPRWEDAWRQKESGFLYKSDILAATDYYNSEVRSFAVQAANKYFKKDQIRFFRYRNLIQCFAVFKEIARKWNYVDDPTGKEYFAKASETVKLLAGDCDDHAILMVSAIKSIGGTARFVITTGHIYPEIMVGNKYDLEQLNFIIKKVLFPAESSGFDLHYHTDESGRIWLNLDYTASYPGGQFFAEPVLGVLNP